MRGTTRTVCILLFIAGCAVVWLATWWGTAPEGGPLLISRDMGLPERSGELTVLSDGRPRVKRARVEDREFSEAVAHAVVSVQQEDDRADGLDTSRVTGQVLDRDTLAPRSMCEVLLLDPLSGDGDVLRARTDEEGRFEFLVPYEIGAPGEFVRLIVRETAGAGELHSSYRALTSELIILVPPARLLSGMLLFDPPPSFDHVTIRIDELAVSGQERFLGVGEAGDDGHFQVPARVREWAELALVSVFDGAHLLASRRVPLAKLSSIEGCTILVDWTLATVSIVDEAGGAIPGAEVVYGAGREDGEWASKVSADEAGLATFAVSRGDYQYAIGASGFSPVIGETSFEQPLHVVLPRVTEEAELSGYSLVGSVEGFDGSAIEGALVFAYLETENEEVGAALLRLKAMSDAEGRFSLTAPAAGTYRLGASYRVPETWLFATSVLSSVVLPSTHEVRIVIEDFGALEVRPTGDFLFAEGFDGSLDYLLLDVERAAQVEGSWRCPPYELQVPIGRYALLLRAPSLGLYGSLEHTLEAGAGHGVLDVSLEQPLRASGYLVDSEGGPLAGVKVEVRSRGILSKSPSAWRSGTTLGDGWYEVPAFGVLGREEEVMLDVDLGGGDVRQARMSLRGDGRTVLGD